MYQWTEKDIERWFDRAVIIGQAEASVKTVPMHITDAVSRLSEGNAHEYFSCGDYWWPNPETADGLPYIRRDGESNPNNFNAHRDILRAMRTAVANLAAGYRLTGDERYADHAVRILREFFLDEATAMAPHLKYAQAIPGKCSGRGIGVIDTLHLVELPFAIEVLAASPSMTGELLEGLRAWFASYLDWMNTHPYGLEERVYPNNHGICWHVQALSFARFAGRQDVIRESVAYYQSAILPNQMREDGALPLELARTKPYGYALFALDNLITLVYLASLCGKELWDLQTPDGKSARLGLHFLLPYLEDKSRWFLPPDIEYDSEWPVRTSLLPFAWTLEPSDRLLALWDRLPAPSTTPEVLRNVAIRQPILMV